MYAVIPVDIPTERMKVIMLADKVTVAKKLYMAWNGLKKLSLTDMEKSGLEVRDIEF